MFKVYYVTIALLLVALIFCTVQAFYTLDTNIRRIDRDIQLLGGTYFAVAAVLPIPLLLLNFIIPRSKHELDSSTASSRHRVEKFGSGSFKAKIYTLLASSAILTFGAAFRAGIAYVPRLRDDPAWYHSKACFYVVNFAVEVLVVALYAVVRVDRRFHVPDGSKGPGDYLRKRENVEEAVGGDEGEEKKGDVEMGKIDGDGDVKGRPSTAVEKPADINVAGTSEDMRLSRVPTLKTSGEEERKISGQTEKRTPVEQEKIVSSEEKTPVEQV